MAAPPQAGPTRAPGGEKATPSSRITTLKKRSEFLAARKGGRWATPLFVVEAVKQVQPAEAAPLPGPRFGFTVSKQVGGAVERNRIKRRLRAAVSQLQAAHARTAYDYVLIARRPALDAPFDAILADLVTALERASQQRRPSAHSKTAGRRAPS